MVVVDFAPSMQVFVQEAICKKTIEPGWNAHLVSISRVDAQRVGVEAEPIWESSGCHGAPSFMLGLAREGWDLNRRQCWSYLDHAIHVRSDGNVLVYENGKSICSTLCRYAPGEHVGLIKNEAGFIEYQLAGHTIFTSCARACDNVRAKICVESNGNFMKNVRWVTRQADEEKQNVGLRMERSADDREDEDCECWCNEETHIENSTRSRKEDGTFDLGPQQFSSTPYVGTAPADDEAITENCFLPFNTAFKKADGRLVLAAHVELGDAIMMSDGTAGLVAEVGRHVPRDYPYAIVQVNTEQGAFKVSAGCRVDVVGESSCCGIDHQSRIEVVRANRLRRGHRVMVGDEARSVTKVREYKERTELVWIRFEHDASVETFSIPSWGIWTRGEVTSDIESSFNIVPLSVLQRTAGGDFSDSDYASEHATCAAKVAIANPVSVEKFEDCVAEVDEASISTKDMESVMSQVNNCSGHDAFAAIPQSNHNELVMDSDHKPERVVPPVSDVVPCALIFPGQGSQYVRMLEAMKDNPAVNEMLVKSKDILGWDVLDLCLNGPEEKLAEHKYVQPAMFIAGLAGREKLRVESSDRAEKPMFTAGFSVGEYTALCAAGVFTFEDGLRLVKLRGEAMQEAAENGNKQLLLTVAGLHGDRLKELCNEAKEQEGASAICSIAVENFPQGYTCGGTEKAIKLLQRKAVNANALQAKLLQSSCAEHTLLMQPAQEKLNAALNDMKSKMSPPTNIIYLSATSEPVPVGGSIDVIVEGLQKHLTSSVLWELTMKKIIQAGCTEYYECGPMKQLKAMMKRIDQNAWKATYNADV